jgi:hypothetical protein
MSGFMREQRAESRRSFEKWLRQSALKKTRYKLRLLALLISDEWGKQCKFEKRHKMRKPLLKV